MKRRNRLAIAAAALATLAVTSTAATASGAAPTPGPAKVAGASGKTASPGGDIVAAAAALGVTPDALIAAIIGAKQSFADGQSPVAPAEFVAAVAERLVLPVAQVSAALEPLMSRPAGTGDKPDGQEGDRAGGKPGDKGVDRDGVKPGDKGGHTAKDTSPSPLTTEAAAQAFAGYAGVTVDQARAALATLVRRSDADGGLQPMDEVYQAVSAELGITTDQLDSALRQLKMSLADD